MKRLGPRLRGTGRAIVDLLLRPERYFRILIRFRSGSLPFLAIWIIGMAYGVGNLDARVAIWRSLGRPIPSTVFQWVFLWPKILIGGLISGCMAWLIRGWWFRARLRICGAGWVPGRPARLVWAHAEAVWALPSLLVLIVVTPIYRDYEAVFDAGPLSVTVLMLMFWSVFVAYRGVISCFQVKRGPALWWFLILPMGWYALAVLAFVAFGLIALL